ncbi:hypothetical protein B0J11DRAFT_509881 [Dendryphion nanum]|uniref:Uncharacterized protein n=1 Tax=Dendryphion nanum TaxID=256645 RepID=A0A9P9DCK1_9PLEO|nr:hypothetical protein B0J11DRAFT_509881 [Dendryphion nanum]
MRGAACPRPASLLQAKGTTTASSMQQPAGRNTRTREMPHAATARHWPTDPYYVDNSPMARTGRLAPWPTREMPGDRSLGNVLESPPSQQSIAAQGCPTRVNAIAGGPQANSSLSRSGRIGGRPSVTASMPALDWALQQYPKQRSLRQRVPESAKGCQSCSRCAGWEACISLNAAKLWRRIADAGKGRPGRRRCGSTAAESLLSPSHDASTQAAGTNSSHPSFCAA